MVSIGSVEVTVVPDARNFDRDLAAQLNPQAKAAGERVGQDYTQGIQDKVKKNLPQAELPAPDTKKSDAEVDRFLRDFNAKMKKEYDQTGQDSGNMLADGLRLSFLQKSPLIAAAVAGGLIAGAPLAIAGAGVLFAGIAAVAERNNLQLKEATTGAVANIGEVFSTAAQVTVPMFTAALGRVTLAVQQMRPELQTAFSGIGGPLESLTTGVINLVQNAMPGLLTALRNAGPVFSGLSTLMSEVGTGLGQFFQLVSQHGSEAGQVFASLGQILGTALPILGRLADVGVQLGAQILPPIAGALRLVADALNIVAPVLPVVVAGLGGLMIARALQGPLQTLAQSLAFASYNGSAFAGTAGKLSTAVSGLASGLPALGVAVGVATQLMQRSDEQAQKWAQDLLNGGKAADTARAQMSNFGSAMAATNTGTDGFIASIIGLGVPMENTAIALGKVKGAQKDLTDQMSPLQQAQQKVTQAQNDYLAVMADPRHTLLAANEAADKVRGALDNQKNVTEQLDSVTKNTDATVQTFKGALQTTADAASAANTQIGLLKTSLDALTGKTISMDQAEVAVTNATIAATQALQGKAGALVDATGKLNLHTEAGAAAFTALTSLAGADNTLIATMEQQGATTDQVRAKDADLRDSFIKTAEKMGFSADQAHNLADQIYGIPQQRDVQINTNAADARAAIKTVQDQIDNLHGRNVTITVLAQSSAGPAAYAVPGSGTGGLAEGGFVSGPGGPKDDLIPAMLSNGEWVVPADATSKYRRMLEWITDGKSLRDFPGDLIPQYASGGPVIEDIDVNTAPFNTGIQDIANKVRDSMSGFVGALNFATAQVGKPYIWGGVGPDGYDCSGFMSAITNFIHGSNPYSRVGTTYTFPWPGFAPGLGGNFAIGSSMEHMAGTLLGHPVESTGDHVRVDGDAHGAGDGQFFMQAHLDTGGWIHPGKTLVTNDTGKPERVLTNEQWAGVSGANVTVIAQFGDETIEAKAVRVVTGALGMVTQRGDYNG